MEQWLPLPSYLSSSPPCTLSLSSLTASPSSSNPLIWLQTLPFSIQTRILSLLAAKSRRFCPRRLQSLACHIMNSDLPSSSDHPAFWVRRAARNLFDALPGSVLESEQRTNENEFDSLPHWLQNFAKTSTPLLPWLPINVSQLQKAATFELAKKSRSKELVSKNGKIETLLESEDIDVSPPPLLPQSIQKAAALKAELLAIDCTADSLHLADEIRQLCLESGVGNELKVLELIEPWKATDETLSVLLLHLVNDGGLFSKSWPSYVICSMALPKLLTLQCPASRVLLSATIFFCKGQLRDATEKTSTLVTRSILSRLNA